ncbi:FtsW/RodA/SpoVE family cell cycle protein [Shigella flexneri]
MARRITRQRLAAWHQSQLEFLPERHTDIMFAGIGGRAGISGHLILLALYILLIMRGL